MTSVILLWHVDTRDDAEDSNLIDVYATDLDADAAIDRLKNKPGFVDVPSGFMK